MSVYKDGNVSPARESVFHLPDNEILLSSRERNRVHARNTRERKRAQMDLLQQRIQELSDEVPSMMSCFLSRNPHIQVSTLSFRKKRWRTMSLKSLSRPSSCLYPEAPKAKIRTWLWGRRRRQFLRVETILQNDLPPKLLNASNLKYLPHSATTKSWR